MIGWRAHSTSSWRPGHGDGDQERRVALTSGLPGHLYVSRDGHTTAEVDNLEGAYQNASIGSSPAPWIPEHEQFLPSPDEASLSRERLGDTSENPWFGSCRLGPARMRAFSTTIGKLAKRWGKRCFMMVRTSFLYGRRLYPKIPSPNTFLQVPLGSTTVERIRIC